MRPLPSPPADRPITKSDVMELARAGLGWEDIMVRLRIMKNHGPTIRKWVLEGQR